MAFVIRFVKGVGNHWKKSTVFGSLIAYGVSYGNEKYEIKQLMRKYCKEASEFGDTLVSVDARMHKVLVILNPAANKKSSEEDFQDYCEPILHLAGYGVEILKTDSEGHARRHVEELEMLPDAIIIAGGDGTVAEAVTGLQRRRNNDKCPIGIVPVGRTNTLAKFMFSNRNNDTSTLEDVRAIANAAISVVRGKTEKKDLMQIEVLPNEADENVPSKPVYAVGTLQWGAFRDILSMRDKYWYTAGLRDYTAFLFNSFDDDHTWNCVAKVTYTDPCSGCKNCFVKNDEKALHSNRWWSMFVPKFTLGKARATGPDYSKIVNDNCAQLHEIEMNASEVILTTGNIHSTDDQNDPPKLNVQIGQTVDSAFSFIADSWSRIWNNKLSDCATDKSINVRTIELIPNKIKLEDTDKDIYYSIDNEAYDVRPIRVSLVPKAVEMFTL